MFYDPDLHECRLFHSCLVLRVPVSIDRAQLRLTLGITCPRHRALLKAKLGRLGRWLPDKEWVMDDDGQERLVSVRRP